MCCEMGEVKQRKMMLFVGESYVIGNRHVIRNSVSLPVSSKEETEADNALF
jgi:hypothetical protein